ncbi:chemotaxis protein [Pseudalkalibacillus berkeleyi]|uniref:Chemotaxis protein n=1 Tax=Pseudalkalibacillus berkeleyi TaxID=1069813 RepID=A0ABS9GX44_9BACL|nr:chemotaxis protein [Pseudalkalibacillus berkeleyi]MCF6137352.1 chemotaxis protein [Pseudalkalibacillus berkeleyi]
MQKIGIAVIHGAGIQKEDFAEILICRLKEKIEQVAKSKGLEITGEEFVFIPIYWGEVFHDKELKLWEAVQKGGPLDFLSLRKFMIEFLGDAIAYQPTDTHYQNYERVHETYFKALERLSEQVGHDSPLMVIGHSLGTVITSNYFYDVQKVNDTLPYIKDWLHGASPLSKGETLASFVSLGSPLALWSLRFYNFDKPIQVPSKDFKNHYPNAKGGWWNIYDRDDVLGYPLKTLNHAYDQAVNEDIEMNIGNLLTNWNPLSHFQYVKDEQIIQFIVQKLISLHSSL